MHYHHKKHPFPMLEWPLSRLRNRQELLKLSTPLQLRLPCCEGTLSRLAVAHSSPNSKPTPSPMLPVLTGLATAMRQPAAALREGQVAEGAGRTKPDGPTGPYESSFSAREGRAKRHYTWWVILFCASSTFAHLTRLRIGAFLALLISLNTIFSCFHITSTVAHKKVEGCTFTCSVVCAIHRR